MSKIRVWKLGSLDHKMYPTKKALDALVKALKARKTKKDFDLVWGPDLNVLEFDSEGIDAVVTLPEVIFNIDENKLTKTIKRRINKLVKDCPKLTKRLNNPKNKLV